MEELEKLHFYVMPSMLGRMGVVIDGELFHANANARDAFLSFEQKDYSLQFQGTLSNIQRVDEHARAQYIAQFQEDALQKAIGRYLWQNADEILFFQCLMDVLPKLDEFDSRINNMPKSDLVTLRAKEIAATIPAPTGDSKGPTKKQIRRTICSLMEKVPSESQFNYSPNLLVMGREQAYQLTPRMFRGDVIFRKNRGKPRMFSTGNPQSLEESFKALNLERMRYYLNQAARSIKDEKLDALIRYCQTKGVHANIENRLEYERSGIMLLNHGDTEQIFIYSHPMGFAMHDIRRGFTERWYPFRNPPKVGVFVYRGKEKIEVSQVHVNGDFHYLHFTSKEGIPQSFCKRGQNRPKNISGAWQEEAPIEIMWGVNSLYNGMNADGLKEYASEEVFGGRYRPPLLQWPWITESQVEAEGLLKTNQHPIINAR